MKAKERIIQTRIVAIARGFQKDAAVKLGEALLEGGISCMEVAFDQSCEQGIQNTLRSISALKERFGDRLAVGAGTVLTPRQADDALAAGAEYIISPDVNPEVIARTKELGMCSVPGAMTPTEVVKAYGCGADFVKLFPVTALGTEYIKALRGPLPHIPLLAVGGVNPDNIAGFIKAGVCGVGVGGNLANARLLEAEGPEAVTELALSYKRALAGI